MTVQHAPRVRAPIPVLVTAASVVPLAVVTCAGAVYFTLVAHPPTSGGLVFLVFFLALKATAVAAAAGLLRGRQLAWRFLLGYALLWEVGFSLVKLVFYGETEALVFAGVALLILVPLLLHPATRRHVQSTDRG